MTPYSPWATPLPASEPVKNPGLKLFNGLHLDFQSSSPQWQVSDTLQCQWGRAAGGQNRAPLCLSPRVNGNPQLTLEQGEFGASWRTPSSGLEKR